MLRALSKASEGGLDSGQGNYLEISTTECQMKVQSHCSRQDAKDGTIKFYTTQTPPPGIPNG